MARGSSVTPHSILEKFEFYFLGLTFTLFGASIQTANFSQYDQVSTISEIVGWVFMAVSGLVGLAKVEHISVLMTLTNQKSDFQKIAQELAKCRAAGYPNPLVAETGQRMSFDEMIGRINRRVDGFEVNLKKIGWRHEVRHHVQRWGFVVGLILVAFARAFSGVLQNVVS